MLFCVFVFDFFLRKQRERGNQAERRKKKEERKDKEKKGTKQEQKFNTNSVHATN